ncbi:DNA/RNA non-specific endonuclease [Aquimarina brevivitae]|uniref:Endonuclease G n=1 Tax=Aquimarina brevivitae TaxID=323412 RepID=A0A4Q7PEU2_9FLAO|nr:DNA/RNA non-specific endonuclease [Aquimarina brevivitae]RZS98954.1 endonuclease G [Aquimarina brevivitae]
MKQKVIYTVLMILSVIIFYYAEKAIDFYNYTQTDTAVLKENFMTYLPSSTRDVVIHRRHFSFSYREEHEQAEWVMYYLAKNKLTDSSRKRPYFERDPFVMSGSADWRNYKNSGYQRGHLCPAGDMKFDKEAYEDTFYTSNITPQSAQFNGGIWNQLEHQVRKLAMQKDSLLIITGGVLSPDLDRIGYERVSVPHYFFKIIFYPKQDYKAIAFLIPQENFGNDLNQYITNIDAIEAHTGIDFFKQLDSKKQEKLESTITLDFWNL